MIKILICDDEKLFLERLAGKINTYLQERELSFQRASFCSGEELLKNSENEFYDVAFLDISIGSVNEIGIAHHLQSINKKLASYL